MPWAVIIIGVFLVVIGVLAVPNIVTGTTATDNLIKTVAPWFAAIIVGVIAVIAIFGRRH